MYCASFTPDGKQGAEDIKIQVWDAHSGVHIIGPLKGHTHCVAAIVFSGDGTRIASASLDMTVRVWNATSGRLICGPLKGHTDRVLFVAFSLDGKRIVSLSKGGNVCVWDADRGTVVVGPSQWHDEGALTVLFTPSSTLYALSPNGRWIERCTDSDSPEVMVCDSKTGQFSMMFQAHTRRVRSVAFSPDSKRILSTSTDGTIQVHTFDW
jgi:WD40 repeat protein